MTKLTAECKTKKDELEVAQNKKDEAEKISKKT